MKVLEKSCGKMCCAVQPAGHDNDKDPAAALRGSVMLALVILIDNVKDGYDHSDVAYRFVTSRYEALG